MFLLIFFLSFFLSLSSSWPSFGHTFVPHISFTLIFNGMDHYILLLPVICFFLPFFVIFLFFSPFLLFILYFVYSIISIFYYCWLSYFSPQFLFTLLLFQIHKWSHDISNRHHRHFNTGLAFDCLVFSLSWVTLCDHP